MAWRGYHGSRAFWRGGLRFQASCRVNEVATTIDWDNLRPAEHRKIAGGFEPKAREGARFVKGFALLVAVPTPAFSPGREIAVSGVIGASNFGQPSARFATSLSVGCRRQAGFAIRSF